jgi:hypothetical protein
VYEIGPASLALLIDIILVFISSTSKAARHSLLKVEWWQDKSLPVITSLSRFDWLVIRSKTDIMVG